MDRVKFFHPEFPLQSLIADTNHGVWTGLDSNGMEVSNYNCNDWTSNNEFDYAVIGLEDQSTSLAFNFDIEDCSQAQYFQVYCVEQTQAICPTTDCPKGYHCVTDTGICEPN